MVEHRTPRAHLQSSASEDDTRENIPVSPHLVEYLEREFPVRVSPQFPSAMNMAERTLQDQAEQRGRQEVIDHLRTLSNRE